MNDERVELPTAHATDDGATSACPLPVERVLEPYSLRPLRSARAVAPVEQIAQSLIP
jgi:hypothetical protein